MNVFKKIISAVIATATLMAGTAFPVSATNYSSCDLDRNGYVDLTDAILMNKYLAGNIYMYDNSIIDVDGNSIVSPVDNNCILADYNLSSFSNRVKGISKTFTLYQTSNVPTTNHSTSQLYAKYNYNTNTESTYNLSLQEYNNLVATASSEDDYIPGILGPDSREADAINGIVYLSSGGTGFIVGDHVIATSAHCVYNRQNSEWISDLKITLPDENGKATGETISVVEAHMPNAYKTNSSDMYDYALITVNTDLRSRYHFNLGIPYNIYTNSDFERYTIYSTGYSQYIPDGDDPKHQNSYPTPQMYTGEGKLIKGGNAETNLFCYDTDITYGNSGGPVYVKEDYTEDDVTKESFTVISICSGIVNANEPERNTGPIMNAIMLKFYKNNQNILY